MRFGERRASLRAAFWATVIVFPGSAAFYINQFTHLVHGNIVLGLTTYVLCLPLLPGLILTMILVATVTLIGNTRIMVAVISHQFTMVEPMLNWIFYYGVLLFIFRRRDRIRERSL